MSTLLPILVVPSKKFDDNDNSNSGSSTDHATARTKVSSLASISPNQYRRRRHQQQQQTSTTRSTKSILSQFFHPYTTVTTTTATTTTIDQPHQQTFETLDDSTTTTSTGPINYTKLTMLQDKNDDDTIFTIGIADSCSTLSTTTTINSTNDKSKKNNNSTNNTIGGMIRIYGSVFIITYFTIQFITVLIVFIGIQCSILDPITILYELKRITKSIVENITIITSSASLTPIINNATTTVSTSVPSQHSTTTTTKVTTLNFVIELMNQYTITQSYSSIIQSYPLIANFIIAYILVKFTQPLRLVLSIFITPKIAYCIKYHSHKIHYVHDEEDSV